MFLRFWWKAFCGGREKEGSKGGERTYLFLPVLQTFSAVKVSLFTMVAEKSNQSPKHSLRQFHQTNISALI
jgi:hypothetical protein